MDAMLFIVIGFVVTSLTLVHTIGIFSHVICPLIKDCLCKKVTINALFKPSVTFGFWVIIAFILLSIPDKYFNKDIYAGIGLGFIVSFVGKFKSPDMIEYYETQKVKFASNLMKEEKLL